MYQSKLFTKTRKEAPADEVSKNAQLLIRAGFVYKEMAGVYTYLPLGLRVINKIEHIIREEMNKIGGLEMKTSILQDKEIWETSDRWSDEIVDTWFKTKLINGGEVGLSWTNEESHTNILKRYISSYKDLPIYPYDFKTTLRNEMRAKSGILRGREFYWKALYSFSRDEAEHDMFYETIKQSYINIFQKVGIGNITYLTFASGGTFSKFSHEFQMVTSAGEDTIYVDEATSIAVNKEVYTDEILASLHLEKEKLVEKTAIEVGNIFSLGTKFSVPFNVTYTDEGGENNFVIMGSYGIGLSRLMGAVVEALSDEKGIVWPESIAPFRIHIISLGKNEEAEDLYKKFTAQGFEVLFDDRDISAGAKLADADLIGIPHRIVVSQKSLDAGGYEYKKRNEKDTSIVSYNEILTKIG